MHDDKSKEVKEFWISFSNKFQIELDKEERNNQHDELLEESNNNISIFLKEHIDELLKTYKNNKDKEIIESIYKGIESLQNIEKEYDISKNNDIKLDIGKILQRITARIHMLELPKDKKTKIHKMLKDKQIELEKQALLKKNFLTDLNNKMSKVKNLLQNISAEKLEKLTPDEKKILEEILSFIIKHHPLMSSMFQPIKKDGKIIKHEMLVGGDLFKDSLMSQVLGIHKGIFIEMLNSMFMNELNVIFTKQHVISQVYRQEHEKGIDSEIEKVSINISKYELSKPEFLEDLRKIDLHIKKQYKTKELKDLITFEFLENDIDFEDEVIKKNLLSMKNELGIEFGMDDFGIGESDENRYDLLKAYNYNDTPTDLASYVKIDMALTSAEMIGVIFEKEDFSNQQTATIISGISSHFSNIMAYEKFNEQEKQTLKKVINEALDSKYSDKIKSAPILGIKLYDEITKDTLLHNYIQENLASKGITTNIDFDKIESKRNEMNYKRESLIQSLEREHPTKKTIIYEFIDYKSMEDEVNSKNNESTNIEYLSQGFLYKKEFKKVYHQDVHKKFYNTNGFGIERRKRKRNITEPKVDITIKPK